jgi:hypothetical protein
MYALPKSNSVFAHISFVSKNLSNMEKYIKKLNSVAIVRKRTIPTERSECQLLRVEGVVWSAQRIPTAVNLGFLDRSRYFFIQVAPQV